MKQRFPDEPIMPEDAMRLLRENSVNGRVKKRHLISILYGLCWGLSKAEHVEQNGNSEEPGTRGLKRRVTELEEKLDAKMHETTALDSMLERAEGRVAELESAITAFCAGEKLTVDPWKLQKHIKPLFDICEAKERK